MYCLRDMLIQIDPFVAENLLLMFSRIFVFFYQNHGHFFFIFQEARTFQFQCPGESIWSKRLRLVEITSKS